MKKTAHKSSKEQSPDLVKLVKEEDAQTVQTGQELVTETIGSDLKRGIDFSNRLGGKLGQSFEQNYLWRDGGEFTIITFAFLVTVYVLNLFFVFPIFKLDLTPAFASSNVLSIISNYIASFGLLSQSQFYLIITIMSLTTAPISLYLFVRRNVFRHDSIAFLATLVYILPNPIFHDGLPLIRGIFAGDGAHSIAFAFIPLILMGFQIFITRGIPLYGVLAAIGTSAIAIISPFATFNLLIFATIITISAVFQGNLRAKIIRLALVLISASALSFFWYFPEALSQIVKLGHVEFTIRKMISILPIAIPIIPVVGTLLFLIFDRRDKLQPFFIGLSMLIVYGGLYSLSNILKVTGIFTPERYLIELSVAASFVIAVLFTPISQFIIRKCLVGLSNKSIYSVQIFVCTALIVLVGMTSYFNVRAAQKEVIKSPINASQSMGVGTVDRSSKIVLNSINIPNAVSFLTLIIFAVVLVKFPSILRVEDEQPVQTTTA